MIIRYLRVSTLRQIQLRQTYMLDNLEITFDKTYEDKITGATRERPALKQMLEEVQAGDTVYCESLSRLGRSLKDLIEIIETLIAKDVRVIIVKENIDTASSTYKLLLGIFGAISELEREQIQERTIQSVEALKHEKETTGEIKTKSGKWFGRQEKTKDELPADFKKYYNRMLRKQINKTEMAKLLGITRKTLYRWIDLYEEREIRY